MADYEAVVPSLQMTSYERIVTEGAGSLNTNEEEIMIQGEDAMPRSVVRLTSASPLFPRR